MKELNLNGSRVFLMGVVKGLTSEAERVESKLEKLDHDFKVGTLPISGEELDGLKQLLDDDSKDVDIQPSTPERIYAENLERFGEVSLPPPSYIFFLRYCRENDKEIEGVDMDEEHYTMAYCDHVTGVQWLRQSFREKRLGKRSIDAENSREFAMEWDNLINKLKGFQKLEEHREEVMAKNIKRLSKRGDLFCILEVERMEGIIENIQNG